MVNRVTKKLDLSLGNKAFILHGGLINDRFIHEDLTVTHIENVLQRFLFDNGFDELTFYHTHERINIISRNVSGRTDDTTAQARTTPGRAGKRRINLRDKVDEAGKPPLDNPIIISSDESLVPHAGNINFARVLWSNALDHFNEAMENQTKKTAIIFRNTHDMQGNGDLNEKFSRLFNLWMREINENIAIFLTTADKLDEIRLPQEIINHIINGNEKSGQVIRIQGCDREELERLIKRKIILDKLEIDFSILPNTIDVLGGISVAKELALKTWESKKFFGSARIFDKNTLRVWKAGNPKLFNSLGDKTLEKLHRSLNEIDTEELYSELSVIRDQDDNIRAIVTTLDDWYLGPKTKPLTFLLCGTSGTGKTFTAEKLAESLNAYGYTYYYRSMTDFNSEADLNKLIGSPTGYVGSETEPELFVKIRESGGKLIICFDEIDKAHEKIPQSLMQLFEKGILNWNNVTGDFSKCIFLLTSNAGMDTLVKLKINFTKNGKLNDTPEFDKEFARILGEVNFPSFIVGRMNKKLIYNPLSDSAILDITVQETQKYFNEKKPGFVVTETDPEYLMEILKSSTGSTLGARVIKVQIGVLLNDNEVASRFIKNNTPPASIKIKYIDKKTEIIIDTQTTKPDLNAVKKKVLEKYEIEKSKPGIINVEGLKAKLSVIKCQEDNIKELVDSVRGWYLRPLSPLVFFLAGTSGTGKSFTAEKLAEAMSDHGYLYKFIPMNQYPDEQSAYEIFGVPKGFTGSKDKPKLFEDLEQSNGRLIICFDEVEKAYTGFYNRIMVLLDKGILGWNNGTGDFRKCIILMTSNIAMDQFMKLKKRYRLKKSEHDDNEAFNTETAKILNDNGIPSFITGRISKTLIYNSLDAESVYDIAIMETRKFIPVNYTIKFISPGFLAEVIRLSANSNEGARKVGKVVKSLLEERIADFATTVPYGMEIVILNGEMFDEKKKEFSIAAFDSTTEYSHMDDNRAETLRLHHSEMKKMSKFDIEEAETVFSKVVGQEDVIEGVIRSLRNWYLQKVKSKPLSLLFAGVSGTGKTFTAQTIAEVFSKIGYEYHEEDMTQYVSELDITRFIGSAEGFVGSDKPPLIVEKLKIANGKMIICFDEIDKAHPAIMNSFMQIMDQGRLKTNKEEFDLRNCILVFTSNGAMDELTHTKTAYKGDPEDEEFQREIAEILGKAGFPSFILGRLEKIFVFNPFSANIVIDLAIAETQKFVQTYDPELNFTFIQPELLVDITKSAAGSNQGARMVSKVVKSVIADAVLAFLEEQDGFSNLSILKEGSQVKIIEDNSGISSIEQCRKEAVILLGLNSQDTV